MEKIVAESEAVRQILRSLRLTRTLYVSTLLFGPPATGKRALIRSVFPELPEVDGRDTEALKNALALENELIISSFEAVTDPRRLDFRNKRILAIADREINPGIADECFAFIYRMPPLKERPEDLQAALGQFLAEARSIFSCSEAATPKPEWLDIRDNLRSLKASVYREVLLHCIGIDDIEEALEHFFARSLEGSNAYREYLGLLERPMLKAGLRRYGSQLKLAEVLGINRNTLRKKLHEYRID